MGIKFGHNLAYRELAEYVDRLTGGVRVHLDATSEKNLVGLAKSGDPDAWLTLVRANAGLIMNFLGKYESYADSKGVSLCDLASDLLAFSHKKFLRYFDCEKNNNFSSFFLNRSICDPMIKRIIHNYASRGIKGFGKEAHFSELPNEGRYEPDSLDYYYKCIYEKQKEIPTPADYASLNLDCPELREGIDTLDERSRKIIEGVYLGSKSYHQIGRELNFSAEYIRILHNRAINKLRSGFVSDINLEKILKQNGK